MCDFDRRTIITNITYAHLMFYKSSKNAHIIIYIDVYTVCINQL